MAPSLASSHNDLVVAYRADNDIAGLADVPPGRPEESLDALRSWVSTSGDLTRPDQYARVLTALFWVAREHYAEDGLKSFWPHLEAELDLGLSPGMRTEIGEWYRDALHRFGFVDPPTPGLNDYVNKIVFHAGLPGSAVRGLLRFIADVAEAIGGDAAELTPPEVADFLTTDSPGLQANLPRLLASRWRGVAQIWRPLARIVIAWQTEWSEDRVEDLRTGLPATIDWRHIAEGLSGLNRVPAGGRRCSAEPPPQLRYDSELGAVQLWVPSGGRDDWTISGADRLFRDRLDRGTVAHLTRPPDGNVVARRGDRARTFRLRPSGFVGIWFNARSGVLADGGQIDWDGLAPGEYFLLLPSEPAESPGERYAIDRATFGGGDWTCWRVDVDERSSARPAWTVTLGARRASVELSRRPVPRITLPGPVAEALLTTDRGAGEAIPVFDRMPVVRVGQSQPARLFRRGRHLTHWDVTLRPGAETPLPDGGPGVYFLRRTTGVDQVLTWFAVLPGVTLSPRAYSDDGSAAAVTVSTTAPRRWDSSAEITSTGPNTWRIAGDTVQPWFAFTWRWPESLWGDLTFRVPLRGLRWRLLPRDGEPGSWTRDPIYVPRERVTRDDVRLEVHTPGRGDLTLNGRPITKVTPTEAGNRCSEELNPHLPSGRLTVGWDGRVHPAVVINERPYLTRFGVADGALHWALATPPKDLRLVVWDPEYPSAAPRDLAAVQPWRIDWTTFPSATTIAVGLAVKKASGFGRPVLHGALLAADGSPACVRVARKSEGISAADSWPQLLYELSRCIVLNYPFLLEGDVLRRLRGLNERGLLSRTAVEDFARKLTGTAAAKQLGERLLSFVSTQCPPEPRRTAGGVGPGESRLPYPDDLRQYVEDLARLGAPWKEAMARGNGSAALADLGTRADRVLQFHQANELPYAGTATAWARGEGELVHPTSRTSVRLQWDGPPSPPHPADRFHKFRTALGLTPVQITVRSDYTDHLHRPSKTDRPVVLDWDPVRGEWNAAPWFGVSFRVPPTAIHTVAWQSADVLDGWKIKKRLEEWSNQYPGPPTREMGSIDVTLRHAFGTGRLHSVVLDGAMVRPRQLLGHTLPPAQDWAVSGPVLAAWRFAWLDRLSCWLGDQQFRAATDAGPRAIQGAHALWESTPDLMSRMTALAEFACRALLGGGLGLALRAARSKLPTEAAR